MEHSEVWLPLGGLGSLPQSGHELLIGPRRGAQPTRDAPKEERGKTHTLPTLQLA